MAELSLEGDSERPVAGPSRPPASNDPLSQSKLSIPHDERTARPASTTFGGSDASERLLLPAFSPRAFGTTGIPKRHPSGSFATPLRSRSGPPRSAPGVAFAPHLQGHLGRSSRPMAHNKLLSTPVTSSDASLSTPSTPPSISRDLPETPHTDSSLALPDSPVIPVTPSSPPTSNAPPSSAPQKPKSWADLLRSPGAAATSPRGRGNASLSSSLASLPPPPPSKGLRSPSQAPSSHASPPPNSPAALSAQPVANGAASQPNGATEHSSPSSEPASRPLSLEQKLAGVETAFEAPYLYPRGLINNGNICFANAVLQVLVHCAPFYNLLRRLNESTTHDFSSKTPMLDAMIAFAREFHAVEKSELEPMPQRDDGERRWKPPLQPPQDWVSPFVAESVWAATRGNTRFDAMRRGQQEDAQEFLGFFLDTIHEELLAAALRHDQNLRAADGEADLQSSIASLDTALSTASLTSGPGADGADEWMEVGSKGKAAFTRSTESSRSAITSIFDLRTRSVLHRPGQKDSVTFEPNNAIQLDIQPDNVNSIEDALRHLCTPDVISDMTTRNGVRVAATKQVLIDTFPPVLVLHIKRFLYDNVGGTQKSTKMVSYGTELEVPSSVQAPGRRTQEPVLYRLFAVVYHHGPSALGGHYTVSLRQHLTGSWIYVDDTHIRGTTAAAVAVNATKAVKPPWASAAVDGDDEGKTAYLLFYTRIQ